MRDPRRRGFSARENPRRGGFAYADPPVNASRAALLREYNQATDPGEAGV